VDGVLHLMGDRFRRMGSSPKRRIEAGRKADFAVMIRSVPLWITSGLPTNLSVCPRELQFTLVS
jgi:hypothetical protein